MNSIKYKRFKIIEESDEKFEMELNYGENRIILPILLSVFSIIYLIMIYFVGDIIIQPPFQGLKLIYNVIVSIIFLFLIGLFLSLLIRSIFFRKRILLDKTMSLLKIKVFYGIFAKEEEILITSISNIYIRDNNIKDIYGRNTLTNYSLRIKLNNGKIINIFTIMDLNELELMEKNLIKNLPL